MLMLISLSDVYDFRVWSFCRDKAWDTGRLVGNNVV